MSRLFITLLLVFSLCCTAVFSEDITISSEVDRREIEFGDQIQLTVSIKKPLSQGNTGAFSHNGFSFSFNSFNMNNMEDVDFDISSIPNFDIIGRRSSQQSRSVNGKGESVKQIILSLVPQGVGDYTIPAFSLKDKDGQEHSSEPIKIKVSQVAEETEEAKSAENEDRDNSTADESKSENNLFTAFLVLGVVLILVVAGVMIFAYMFGSKGSNPSGKAGERNSGIEEAVIVEKETVAEMPKKPEVERVEFGTISASLKAQYKEINAEFYRKYFELFKKACCYRSNLLSKDMTFDELLLKCGELAGTNNIKQAASRMAHDIELVMYANSTPNRQLIAIESDIKEILNSL